MKPFVGYNRGVNLGGWLSQCDHTKERYDTFITENDFSKIASRDFDHVRIPVDYELFENKDRSFKEEGFAYIDFAISMCRKYNLNMILDLHRTPGYSFDPFHGELGFFDSEDYQNHFYVIWEELAKRFGQNVDMLTFELLNEVTAKEYSDTWNRVALEAIGRIRKISPDIRIIIGGYYNNSLWAVPDLPIVDDENIIYTFHCYEPLIFTHQGAFWIASMDTSFRCPFDLTYDEFDKLSQKYLCQAYAPFDAYDPKAKVDDNYFEVLLEKAIKTAEERNVPLYCGEYGVIDRAFPEDAVKWFEIFHRVLDRHKIGRAVWNYKQMDFEISEDF